MIPPKVIPPERPVLRIDAVTVFPDYLAPLRMSLLGRAASRGILSVNVHDLRDWTHDVHKAVDDSPFGGGPGMVMRPTVWGEALDELAPTSVQHRPLLIVPTPAGRPFSQADAHRYAQRGHIIFACGRYEGIDQRVLDEASKRMDVEEVSIGDYVLIGGEVAVLAITEAVVRLIPGVLGNARSHQEDSFSNGLLEGPSYTRPESWRGHRIPEVLTSGNHARIERWRRDSALRRTAERRPELLDKLPASALDTRDREVLEEFGWFGPST